MNQSKTIYPGEVFADTKLFDRGIRQLIPHYDLMLDTLVACVSIDAHRILDLGCGTGELSLKLLKHCPNAKVMAVDYSPRMLEMAKSKLEKTEFLERIRFIQGDFGAWANGDMKKEIGTNFDACVSSLAIHHLTDEMKYQLLTCIGKNLRNGGCFWNADPILQESPQLQDIYGRLREQWTISQGSTITKVRSQMGNSQAQGHSGQDRLATLETHLTMLSSVGFKTVAVPWRFFGLAVFGGWV
ncbi:class I SAM-dependent methyltransferase [Crocosphaera subtropica]|nr:class I SAM-dependent methyltransferase [Crocosphaera subtropica]